MRGFFSEHRLLRFAGDGEGPRTDTERKEKADKSAASAPPVTPDREGFEKSSKELTETMRKADPDGRRSGRELKRLSERRSKVLKTDDELSKREKSEVEEARKTAEDARPRAVEKRAVPADKAVLPDDVDIKDARLAGYQLRTIDGVIIAAKPGSPQIYAVERGIGATVNLTELVGNNKQRFSILLTFVGNQRLVDGASLPGAESAYNYGRRGDSLIRYAKNGQETLVVNPAIDNDWRPLYQQLVESQESLGTSFLQTGGYKQEPDGTWKKPGSPWEFRTDGTGRWLARDGANKPFVPADTVTPAPTDPEQSTISNIASISRISTKEGVQNRLNSENAEAIRREGAVQILKMGAKPNGEGWEYSTGFSVNVNPQFQFVGGRWAVRWFTSEAWSDPGSRRAASGSGENEINAILEYLAGLNERIGRGVPLTFARPPDQRPVTVAPLVPQADQNRPPPDPTEGVPEDQRDAVKESIIKQFVEKEGFTTKAARAYEAGKATPDLLSFISNMQDELQFLRQNSALMDKDTPDAKRNFERIIKTRIATLEEALKKLEPVVRELAMKSDQAIKRAREKIMSVIGRERQQIINAYNSRAAGGTFGSLKTALTNSDPYALLITDSEMTISRMNLSLERLNKADAEPDGLNKLRAVQGALNNVKTANRSDAAFYQEVFAIEQEAITVTRDVSIAVITTVVPVGAGVAFSTLRTAGTVANAANAAKTPFLVAVRNSFFTGAVEGAGIAAPGAVGKGVDDVNRGAKTVDQAVKDGLIEVGAGAGLGGTLKSGFTAGGRGISALRGSPGAEPPVAPGGTTPPRAPSRPAPVGDAAPPRGTGGRGPTPAPEPTVSPDVLPPTPTPAPKLRAYRAADLPRASDAQITARYEALIRGTAPKPQPGELGILQKEFARRGLAIPDVPSPVVKINNLPDVLPPKAPRAVPKASKPEVVKRNNLPDNIYEGPPRPIRPTDLPRASDAQLSARYEAVIRGNARNVQPGEVAQLEREFARRGLAIPDVPSPVVRVNPLPDAIGPAPTPNPYPASSLRALKPAELRAATDSRLVSRYQVLISRRAAPRPGEVAQLEAELARRGLPLPTPKPAPATPSVRRNNLPDNIYEGPQRPIRTRDLPRASDKQLSDRYTLLQQGKAPNPQPGELAQLEQEFARRGLAIPDVPNPAVKVNNLPDVYPPKAKPGTGGVKRNNLPDNYPPEPPVRTNPRKPSAAEPDPLKRQYGDVVYPRTSPKTPKPRPDATPPPNPAAKLNPRGPQPKPKPGPDDTKLPNPAAKLNPLKRDPKAPKPEPKPKNEPKPDPAPEPSPSPKPVERVSKDVLNGKNPIPEADLPKVGENVLVGRYNALKNGTQSAADGELAQLEGEIARRTLNGKSTPSLEYIAKVLRADSKLDPYQALRLRTVEEELARRAAAPKVAPSPSPKGTPEPAPAPKPGEPIAPEAMPKAQDGDLVARYNALQSGKSTNAQPGELAQLEAELGRRSTVGYQELKELQNLQKRIIANLKTNDSPYQQLRLKQVQDELARRSAGGKPLTVDKTKGPDKPYLNDGEMNALRESARDLTKASVPRLKAMQRQLQANGEREAKAVASDLESLGFPRAAKLAREGKFDGANKVLIDESKLLSGTDKQKFETYRYALERIKYMETLRELPRRVASELARRGKKAA